MLKQRRSHVTVHNITLPMMIRSYGAGTIRIFWFVTSRGLSLVKAWGEGQQEKLDGAYNVQNINKIFISGWHPNKSQSELEEMILTAFKKVPNELNKKFSYKEVRKLPFKITITGRISASLTIENVTDELKSALETKFGRDSNFFDPNGVGKYILIKKKRRLGIYRNAGLFPRLLSGICRVE